MDALELPRDPGARRGIINLSWPKRIVCGQAGRISRNAHKTGLSESKIDHVFGHSRRPAKMFRSGIYARVSTKHQQTLAMQNRTMREYAGRRGWMIAMQVREVGSGAAKRQARENLLEAARRARSTSCWCGAWIAGADR